MLERLKIIILTMCSGILAKRVNTLANITFSYHVKEHVQVFSLLLNKHITH